MDTNTVHTYTKIVDTMLKSANSMKNEVSEIYWQEFQDKQHVFDKLKTDSCYWAPEVFKKNFWNTLYKICSINFNNASNPIHRKLLDVYKKIYKQEISKLN
jgi:hypothetical protein